MATKLKTKITLGVVFLFALLVLVGGISFFYLNKTISNQRDILKDNYETIDYTKNMLQALDKWDGNVELFEKNLKGQEGNITEQGEAEATRTLRNHFDIYKANKDSAHLETALRNDINRIMQINLQAILQKNKAVQKDADDAKIVITVILTFCALIGFTFIFNFPGFIANPISKFTEGIKAVANKQYSERIHLNRKDEFGEMAKAFNNMAEELDKYEHSNLAKIMFEKQRAETVINSLKDASIGIDNNGTILFANSQALQLLNIKDVDTVGKKKETLANQNDLFKFLLGEQSNQPFKIVVEGKEEFFTKEIVDITNAEGTIGNVIVLKNITPFKELDVAKTNFMATISHELKTPLASSDFSIKLLEDERVGSLNTEQKELLQNLKNDNQRLLKILSELLNMGQIEAGKIQFSRHLINPHAIIDASLKAVDSTAKEKGVELKKNIAQDLPNIYVDADKLSWVLNNFLTNAIKYSTEGSTVEITVHQDGKDIVFSVKDNGLGIDEIYHEKIFHRYFQVPSKESKKGSGIGLAISKELIEAMGGSIWIKNKLGSGSIFGINIKTA
jgi:NtrC-family two-component system sensor histidine kinase KinB